MIEENFSNSELSLEDLPDFQKVRFNNVSRKLLFQTLLKIIVTIMVFSAGAGFFFYQEGFDRVVVGIYGLLVVFFLIRAIDAVLKQKYYGFALREKDIIYRSGYLFQKTIVIPFNRMQHSSIQQSFLDKIFGISSLKIYTAGGSGSDMNIPGLLPDEAKKLNDGLALKVSENE